jgi:hypothetical protein
VLCANSAPDRSSPQGYVWVLVAEHRVKILYASEFLFDSDEIDVE